MAKPATKRASKPAAQSRRRARAPGTRELPRRRTRATPSSPRRSRSSAVSGFAATRLDDVARRAGVAKGTIYLYFADKETLFQELVRSQLRPVVGAFEQAARADMPMRAVAERIIEMFVREIYGTRRKDVIRLVLTEGPRFPKLAEFYYREVVSRAMGAMRARAAARRRARRAQGRRAGALSAASGRAGLVAILWNGLFDRFEPLDVARDDAGAFRFDFGRREDGMSRFAFLWCCSRRWRLAGCSPAPDQTLSGLGRGRSDLRQPRRGRPGRDAGGARRRQRHPGRAAVHASTPTCRRPTCRSRRPHVTNARQAFERAQTLLASAAGTQNALDDAEAALRTAEARLELGADAARAPQGVEPGHRHGAADLFPAGRDGAGRAGRWSRCCRPATSRCASSCRRRCCRRSRSARP